MTTALIFRYLKYANIGGRALRNVLKGDAKAAAVKREESIAKGSEWAAGKQGENVLFYIINHRNSSHLKRNKSFTLVLNVLLRV